MKRLILAVFAVILCLTDLHAFPRNILYELFIAQFCPFSGQRIIDLQDFVEDPQYSENVTAIVYHFMGDPWSILNESGHMERFAYYGIDYFPSYRVDGIIGDVATSSSNFTNAYIERSLFSSPLDINLTAFEDDGEIQVVINVQSEETSVINGTVLRAALINQHYENYTGQNNLSDWAYDLLEWSPDIDGIPFTISAFSEEEFNVSFDGTIPLNNEELDADDVKILVFIQDEFTHEILQSKWTTVSHNHMYSVSSEESSVLCGQNSTTQSGLTITNLGLSGDTYDVFVEDSLFNGWSYQYTIPSGETITGNTTMSLDSYESFTSQLEVFSPDEPGATGRLFFTLVSQNNPMLVREIEFYYQVSSRVLVVNSDNEESNYYYYNNTLDLWDYESNGELNYKTWNGSIEQFTNVVINEETRPELIIDYFGNSTGTISPEHLSSLVNYLEIPGSNLIITGTHIPSVIAHSNVIDYFGIEGANYYNFGTDVYGVNGDPVGNGMDFELTGGDGASNVETPMSIICGEAEACLRYSVASNAAVRYETENYKVVMLGFPYESIADEYSRDQLMYNMLVYTIDYNMSTVRENENQLIPDDFCLKQNYPNPFNPATEISFDLPEHAKVYLAVYNMLGQEVAVLANDNFNAGSYSVNWNAEGFASGVYIYKVKAVNADGIFTQSKKMILMK